MNKQYLDNIRDKKILIWGFGREGKSTKSFLERNNITSQIEVFEGPRDGFNIDDYDVVFKSPGIPYLEKEEKITSQTELFMGMFRDQIIGITGTKGKSTTSSLMHHVIGECSDYKTVLVGNIGFPCLDMFEEIDDNTIVVYELSCHQLNNITVSPHIGIFLNLYEDHLDYYKTREKYFAAKCGITNNQKENDYLIMGVDVPQLSTKANTITISDVEPIKLQIKGEHNVFNANVVKRVAVDILGCDGAAVDKSLYDFTGLAHRLQRIGVVDGVEYYDDSISTIPEATIRATNSIPNAATVLVGGMDRNIDYSKLISFIKEKDDINFVCMYASGKRIYNEVADRDNVVLVENLEQAVQCAKEKTKPGSACVLSPAAASYDSFKNFEERGDVFKQIVGL